MQDEKLTELCALSEEYAKILKKGLKLDMSRGKPCREQIDLSDGMLHILDRDDCIKAQDYRNYGILDGIPEAKKLMADIAGVDPENVIVCGNSSLNLMYDALARCMLYGNGKEPWVRQGKVKFIAPAPGYDRHFAVCESLGIEMICVDMTDDGPDMDTVEKLVAADASIKGMWNVPKYSNPGGVVYSAKTVERIAKMKCAADDFLVMWDNAYIVHALRGEPAEIPEILSECAKAGNPDRVLEFISTSKISYPGAGISAVIASKAQTDRIKKIMASQTIGYDKINQLRHVKFFGDADGVRAQMKRHAAIIAPKFDAVLEILEKNLAGTGIASWSHPQGGYFISYYVPEGCAKRTVALCAAAGVKLTGAGAAYPYGRDPHDSNIRIAPTLPPISELREAIEVLCLCTKIASLEKETGKMI